MLVLHLHQKGADTGAINQKTSAGSKVFCLLSFIKGAFVNNFSISSSCRPGHLLIAMSACAVLTQSVYADDPSVESGRFTNIGSLANTRHNMTQSTAPLNSTNMSSVRNDYAEICIYCHLPLGANHTIAAPLWKSTLKVLQTTRPATNSELPR